MQWLFNLFYKLLDLLFGLLGSIPMPDFISDLTLAITKYCTIVNYYFPLSTLIGSLLIVLTVTIIMMIVSAFLQLA